MKMDDTDQLLFNASGQPMKVKGRIWCQVSYGVTGRSHKVDALVTSSMKDEILISWHDLEALRAVSLILEVKTAPIDQVALQDKMDTLKEKYKDVLSDKLAELPMHSVFFGPFLSGCFFPPNDRAQDHAQENPLLVLFMLAQKCLWTLRVQKCAKKSYFFE
jgi:hypothetical protein